MLKQSVFVGLAAAALLLGGASAAHAEADLGHYTEGSGVTVLPTAIRPLETSVITFSAGYFDSNEVVAIAVEGKSGENAGLASLATSTLATFKAAADDGSLVTTFTAPADGNGTYSVSFDASRDYTAVITVHPFDVVDVPSAVTVSDSSLANTGAGLSPAVVWVGIAALAAGVSALLVSVLRRRHA